jgi:DNA-binding winged helix-turn-helix (wHTH) protein/tetratricopeptide (TPR) repeat protein
MNGHVLYRFEEYRIDPARRELWRYDEQVAVQPKAFACLAYLIEHRDRVVGTDELIAAVWGRSDLTDNVVMHSIARARTAIGDSGEQQRAIRTVTRVGYAWSLEVEVIALSPASNRRGNGHSNISGKDSRIAYETESLALASASASSTGSTTTVEAHSPSSSATTSNESTARVVALRSSRVRLYIFGLAAVLLIGVAVVLLQRDLTAVPIAPTEGVTAVVLPVTVIGEADSSSAWIRLGVMDLIAERLRELGQLVIPSDNTVALANLHIGDKRDGTYQREQIETMARTAAAGLILDVQAEAVGDQWRVSLRTVHGRDPAVVAQGEAPDVLAAAGAAADRMAVILGFHLVAPDAGAQEANPIDYTLQQVRAAMLSDQFGSARELLTGLADSHGHDPRVRYELAALDEQRGRLDEAAIGYGRLLSDLQQDWPGILRAKVLFGLGKCHYRQGDYETAEGHFQEAQTALEGQSGYDARLMSGRIQMIMAGLRTFQDRFDEAEASYARARIAFEISGDQFALAKLEANLAALYSRMGRAEAISYGERGAERLAQFGDVQNELRARVLLAVAHYNQENILAAQNQIQHFEPLLIQIDNPRLASGVLITKLGVLLEAGRLQEAERVLNQLWEQQSSSESSPGRIHYYDAGYAHVVGDYERASASAAEAVQQDWEPALYGENADAWLLLMRARIALRQVRRAAQVVQDASDWSETTTGERVEVATVLALMRGEHAAFTGDEVDAVLNFDEALALADQTRSPVQLVRVVRSYVEWLIARGDLERAGVLAGRISALSDRSFGAALVQLRLYHAMGEPNAWRLALDRVRTLSGERTVDADLLVPPSL